MLNNPFAQQSIGSESATRAAARRKMLETVGTLHLSMNDFREAQLSTPVGQFFVYAIGDLAWAKHYAVRESFRTADELLGVAGMALRGAASDHLFLCQRRVGVHCFQYLAGVRK